MATAMMEVTGSYRESSGTRTTRSLPLSHVSVEVGHLYRAELSLNRDGLLRHFEQIALWLPRASGQADAPTSPLRMSTCLLLDDYSSVPDETPRALIPRILEAAERAGVAIDYLARESACAESGGSRPVERMLDAIVVEPPAGTTGTRPPLTESGWLCNGVRSPAGPAAAMAPGTWRPPRESAAEGHSVFVDVELWSATGETASPDERRWSCASLAATWQLLRLGLLRRQGEPMWTPEPAPAVWPEDWSLLPALTQLDPAAAPFAAYRTVSLLPVAFLHVEAAVQTILGQVFPDPDVLRGIDARARAEGLDLPAAVRDRRGYAFFGG